MTEEIEQILLFQQLYLKACAVYLINWYRGGNVEIHLWGKPLASLESIRYGRCSGHVSLHQDNYHNQDPIEGKIKARMGNPYTQIQERNCEAFNQNSSIDIGRPLVNPERRSKPLNIIVPIGGIGSRFAKEGRLSQIITRISSKIPL